LTTKRNLLVVHLGANILHDGEAQGAPEGEAQGASDGGANGLH